MVWCIRNEKTDVRRLWVALTRTRGRGLETSKNNKLLEIRVSFRIWKGRLHVYAGGLEI